MKTDRMVEQNRARCAEMQRRAEEAIARMLADGEPLSPSELARRTGLSRAYFYTNSEVRAALAAATEQQRAGRAEWNAALAQMRAAMDEVERAGARLQALCSRDGTPNQK